MNFNQRCSYQLLLMALCVHSRILKCTTDRMQTSSCVSVTDEDTDVCMRFITNLYDPCYIVVAKTFFTSNAIGTGDAPVISAMITSDRYNDTAIHHN